MKKKFICDQCGEEFESYESQMKGKHHFCSRKCYMSFHIGELVKFDKSKEFICDQCRKEFKIYGNYRKGKRHFCSMKCYTLFRNSIAIKDKFICFRCGKEFEKHISQKKHKRTFCSKECYNRFQRENPDVFKAVNRIYPKLQILDKLVLEDLYITQDKSLKEIKEILHISDNILRRSLKEHRIKKIKNPSMKSMGFLRGRNSDQVNHFLSHSNCYMKEAIEMLNNKKAHNKCVKLEGD